MSRRNIFLLVGVAGLIALAVIVDHVRKSAVEKEIPIATAPAGASPLAASEPAGEPTYVGKKVCGECHDENFRFHDASGHAHTIRKTSESAPARTFAGQTFDAGEPYGTFHYKWDDGLIAELPEKFPGETFPIQWAIGSGHNAVTFLSLIPELDGDTVGIEHRVSYLSHDKSIGLTPGHEDKSPHEEVEHFGETIRGKDMHACISCHTTTAKIVDQQITDLIANVNCEKCHGPGSEHVRQARLSDHPPPFSIGRDDWTAESELTLCGECHRLPEDMSAKQMREYPNAIVRFQPVGLLRSACYLETEGQLRCTTCHNPHQASKVTPRADYIQACIECHQENNSSHVTCPVSTTGDCIECHMPAVPFVRGMAFHDHWIRVRDE